MGQGPAEPSRHLSPRAQVGRAGGAAGPAQPEPISRGRFAPFFLKKNFPLFLSPEEFFKGWGKKTQTQKWKPGKRFSSDLGVIVLFRDRGGSGKRWVSGTSPNPHLLQRKWGGGGVNGEDVLGRALATQRRWRYCAPGSPRGGAGEASLGVETRARYRGAVR